MNPRKLTCHYCHRHLSFNNSNLRIFKIALMMGFIGGFMIAAVGDYLHWKITEIIVIILFFGLIVSLPLEIHFWESPLDLVKEE